MLRHRQKKVTYFWVRDNTQLFRLFFIIPEVEEIGIWCTVVLLGE